MAIFPKDPMQQPGLSFFQVGSAVLRQQVLRKMSVLIRLGLGSLIVQG